MVSVRGPERVKDSPAALLSLSRPPSSHSGHFCWHSIPGQAALGRPANRVNEGLSSQGEQPQENEAMGLGRSCQQGARMRQQPEGEAGTC